MIRVRLVDAALSRITDTPEATIPVKYAAGKQERGNKRDRSVHRGDAPLRIHDRGNHDVLTRSGVDAHLDGLLVGNKRNQRVGKGELVFREDGTIVQGHSERDPVERHIDSILLVHLKNFGCCGRSLFKGRLQIDGSFPLMQSDHEKEKGDDPGTACDESSHGTEALLSE